MKSQKKYIRMKTLVFAGVVLFQCVAASSNAAPSYTIKAESSASETTGPNGVAKTAVNTSFAFASLYNPESKSYTEGIISQRIENTTLPNGQRANPKLEAIAWVGGKTKYDKKLWAIDDCADNGWQAGDFYVTSKYVEGEGNILRAYNMGTGKYAFSYTSDPVSVAIAIPNDNIKRYISYLSKARKNSECRKNDIPANAIGALTLSDGNAQIDRVLLVTDDSELVQSPKLSLVNDKEPKGTSSMSLWGPADFTNKSDAVKGFSIKVILRGDKEVIIPVTNDKFDIQAAILPKTIKIQRMSVEKSEVSKL